MDNKANKMQELEIREKIAAGAYENKLPYKTRRQDEKAWTAYGEESARLHSEFKCDALEDVGLANHPKANSAFQMAWDRGRARGHFGVYNELLQLAWLLLND